MADRELLSLNNLSELASLQAELDAAGNGVRLQYVPAVPAARYGEFKAKRQALDAEQDATKPWVAEMAWRTTVKPTAKGEPEVQRDHRLIVAHDPLAAQRRTQARRDQVAELIALGLQWGGLLDAQDEGPCVAARRVVRRIQGQHHVRPNHHCRSPNPTCLEEVMQTQPNPIPLLLFPYRPDSRTAAS